MSNYEDPFEAISEEIKDNKERVENIDIYPADYTSEENENKKDDTERMFLSLIDQDGNKKRFYTVLHKNFDIEIYNVVEENEEEVITAVVSTEDEKRVLYHILDFFSHIHCTINLSFEMAVDKFFRKKK